MKYFSMFSGIGGFELGIERAYGLHNKDGRLEAEGENNLPQIMPNINRTGFGRPEATCIGYSEIDKYAIQIYNKHFNHKNYGNATTIVPSDLPDFDLLVGGFPCQAFSIAGKRKGFDDTRGTLFFDIARILKEKQPRNFVLENVKGLLSHDNGRTFKTIISTLAELGYGVEWQVLNSKNFGVPQNRERVFIIGHLRGTSRPEVFPIGSSNEKDIRNTGEDLSYALDAKGTNTLEKGRRQLVKIVGGLQGHQTAREDGIAPTLTTAMGQGGGQTPIVWSEEIRIRRLTPTECERLQGFPDGWTEGISDSQRYKCCGNAVTVNVVEFVIQQLYDCKTKNH